MTDGGLRVFALLFYLGISKVNKDGQPVGYK